MLDMAIYDYGEGGSFCDDDPVPAPPKPPLADQVVALARRVLLGVIVRAPRLVVTREPPAYEGGAEVHEILVRGFIAVRSHSELLRTSSCPAGGAPPSGDGRRRA
jgi:hypothetical protein